MMLAIHTGHDILPRLVPPPFASDNIDMVLKAADEGQTIRTEAVDGYGNHVAIATPDGIDRDTLGRPLRFSDHPVLARNVRRELTWLLKAEYCRRHAWDTDALGPWEEHVGLPDPQAASAPIPVTGEHLRLLEPVLNLPEANPHAIVERYDIRHHGHCDLRTLLRIAHGALPDYATPAALHGYPGRRHRRLTIISDSHSADWDGMNRVRDKWSGCQWAYPELWRHRDPRNLVWTELRGGGLPESFSYPLRTPAGVFALEDGRVDHALILLDGRPVGVMICEDEDDPLTDIPPEWCAVPLPDGVTGRDIDRVLPDGGFVPSFQQALLGFAERFGRG